MNRRTLLKSALATFAGLSIWKPKKLMAQERKPKKGPVRIVVFAADALRIDTAQDLRNNGSPGLSALNPPICALSGGGLSVTQPGWASIWTGMPSFYNKAFDNTWYSTMPPELHIMRKFMLMLLGQDFYAGWVTGKGGPLKGYTEDSPHFQVYEAIKLMGHLGIYHGDTERENEEVYHLATRTISRARTHQHFCLFIHFRDPDHIGHVTRRYHRYVEKAEEVDNYIANLMGQLPLDTDIIYCSDHGFNFVELGEIDDAHQYAPKGMVATNFPTNDYENVTRESIGRLIYTRGGGDPDHCVRGNIEYSMYGVDL